VLKQPIAEMPISTAEPVDMVDFEQQDVGNLENSKWKSDKE
jgi:hypothetical protein